ncbi:MAG: phytoene desaturase family protein, partial [Acholeplasmataceae bacterium]|nr:phytoene desaturase family protein [Acholeplasmataceae bacterium]
KQERVGGRSRRLSLGDFYFDLGPTFLMYIEVLKNVFSRSGFDLEKELKLIKLDPLYHLVFQDQTVILTPDIEKNREIYDQISPGLGDAYMTWYHDQEKKLEAIKPIIEKPFPNVFHLFRKDVLKASPYVHPFKSVYTLLKQYQDESHFIHSLSFQAKYLGMASYQAPSLFTILPFLEHSTGLFHVEGGLNQINEVMAKLFVRLGGTLLLNAPVKKVNVEDRTIQSVTLDDNTTHPCDLLVMNADFAYGMSHLFNQNDLRKYKHKSLEKKKYSVSTFMIYLGMNQKLDLPHHEIIFSKDYDQYLKDLMDNQITNDLSVYIHNPSLIDKTLAPLGKSSLYILVPVPNLKSGIDFKARANQIKMRVFDLIKEKHGIDLTPLIEKELIYTPSDWETNDAIYQGAVFNLAHGLDQMLFLRPHNHFEEFKNMYLVGGGTHPGSGLPTIYQSALILDDML